jgi:hypothetical protein
MIEGTSFRAVLIVMSMPLCNMSAGDTIVSVDEAGSVTEEVAL